MEGACVGKGTLAAAEFSKFLNVAMSAQCIQGRVET